MNYVRQGGFSRNFLEDQRFRQQVPDVGARLRGANIQDAAAHNRKIILHAIRARGAVGRKELAEITGLTPPAVFKIAKDFLNERLLISTRMREGAKGQPAAVLTLNADAAFTLGLNIDRDHLTFVTLDFAGNIRTRSHLATPFPTPETVRSFFAECVDGLRQDGAIPMSRIVGVGVAMPEGLGTSPAGDPPPGHRQWSQTPVHTVIGDLVSTPLVQENDAASAAIGEMLFGAGLQADSFFYLFICVGLGGGLVINRQYIRGCHGRSGEIGTLPLSNPFRSSRSDLSRTLEHEVSIPGLLEALRKHGIDAADLDDIDPSDPMTDEAIDAWINSAADLLYLPLLGVVSTIDPEAILIGGRLPYGITDRLCEQVARRLSLNVSEDYPDLRVRRASLSADAAAVGAAVLAFKDLWERGS
ncbi:ROK family protein [Asticcacaulis solisilvae]|uniref:ROK family protein n=1 Tax=Asticcacaulis solisilvae TaxID=1217274 RepID=UPI003FD7A103